MIYSVSAAVKLNKNEFLSYMYLFNKLYCKYLNTIMFILYGNRIMDASMSLIQNTILLMVCHKLQMFAKSNKSNIIEVTVVWVPVTSRHEIFFMTFHAK